jgi:hypothetical protein
MQLVWPGTSTARQLGVNLLTLDLLFEATVEPRREILDSLSKLTILVVGNGNKPREWE